MPTPRHQSAWDQSLCPMRTPVGGIAQGAGFEEDLSVGCYRKRGRALEPTRRSFFFFISALAATAL
jgi:hypothetical protein